jgi:hypothetical protein
VYVVAGEAAVCVLSCHAQPFLLVHLRDVGHEDLQHALRKLALPWGQVVRLVLAVDPHAGFLT